jgi:Kdo2-lipid IVA lauroyltransferase/acyltransferase
MKKLEYYIVIGLYSLLKRIPLSYGHNFSVFLSFLIRNVFCYRNQTVKDNLIKAFPNLSEKECKAIEKEVYYNFSSLWIEFLQNWRIDDEYIDKYFNIFGWDVLEDAIKENKGVIVLTGHIGNIEWLGQFMSINLPEIYAIGKKISNPYIHEFVEKNRTQNGAIIIYTKNAFEKSIELLTNNKILAIAGDQDARKRPVWVDFFGIPSATAQGAAVFHLKTDAPIVFMAQIRTKWGQFDLHFEKIQIPENLEFNEKNIFEVTQLHTKVLEKWIKNYPGQYFWTHRRWKSKPSELDLKKYKKLKNESINTISA